ncbi:uncharacterized protein LOC100976922 [Pan paniscus]|uniref:uncharacterized protein LOC100976922 n=1 Tax=Pan paniscus TaxID=9597 RepID=UPI0000E21814|nr:uncharacterized protein LOC100976922 [Pan paniscus]XP_016800924.3 uncharacterized protein FAM131B-AS2 [Pan troglodytes]
MGGEERGVLPPSTPQLTLCPEGVCEPEPPAFLGIRTSNAGQPLKASRNSHPPRPSQQIGCERDRSGPRGREWRWEGGAEAAAACGLETREDGRGRGLLVFYGPSTPTTTHSSWRPRATVGLLGFLRLRLVEPPTGQTGFLSLRLSPRLHERSQTWLLLPPEAFLLFTLSVQSLQIRLHSTGKEHLGHVLEIIRGLTPKVYEEKAEAELKRWTRVTPR